MKRNMLSLHSRRRGVEIVEFALILPVILAVLMAIMEGGWMIKNQLVLANATRDGARFAALGNTSANTIARIKNEAATLNPILTDSQIFLEQTSDKSSVSPTYSSWPSEASGATKNAVPVGNLIRVRIVYQNQALTGFYSFMKNKPLNTAVTMLRESN